MEEQYEFRVIRWGKLVPATTVAVKAESLDGALKEAKKHCRKGERIDRGGFRTEGKTFTVDGAKLTAARLESGFSMEDVALELGCNKANLSRWERGLYNPPEHAILQLVVLLKRGDFVKEK